MGYGNIGSKGVDNFSFANMLYVAKNGDDTIGNGTSYKPFLTIQKALDSAHPTDTDRVAIYVSPGTYNEQLSITQGDISIIGVGINTTLLVWNNGGDVVTVEGTTGYLEIDLTNILINNGGSGRGIVINNAASVTLSSVSCGANDDAFVINGSSFTLTTNGSSFASSTKNGMIVSSGATMYSTNCSFYGNAPTYYDLSVDSRSRLICSGNFYQNNNVNLLGTIDYLDKASLTINDSSISGITVKDALDNCVTKNGINGSFTIGGVIFNITNGQIDSITP